MKEDDLNDKILNKESIPINNNDNTDSDIIIKLPNSNDNISQN